MKPLVNPNNKYVNFAAGLLTGLALTFLYLDYVSGIPKNYELAKQKLKECKVELSAKNSN